MDPLDESDQKAANPPETNHLSTTEDASLSLNGTGCLNQKTGPLTRIYRLNHGFLNLINDEDGQLLFEEYAKLVHIENHLLFWFAVEGFQTRYSEYEKLKLHQDYLRESQANEPDNKGSYCADDTMLIRTRNDLIRMSKAIYNNFIKTNAKYKVYTWFEDATREMIFDQIQKAVRTEAMFDKHIFLDARIEFEKQINNRYYGEFLRSDVYKAYVAKQLRLPHGNEPATDLPTNDEPKPERINSMTAIRSNDHVGQPQPQSIVTAISSIPALASKDTNQLKGSLTLDSVQLRHDHHSGPSSGIQSDGGQDVAPSSEPEIMPELILRSNTANPVNLIGTSNLPSQAEAIAEIRAKLDAMQVDTRSMISSQSMRSGFHLPNDPNKNVERVRFFIARLEQLQHEQLHASDMKILQAIEKIERNGAPNLSLRNAIKNRILTDQDSQSILDQHCQRVFRSSEPTSRDDSGSSSPIVQHSHHHRPTIARPVSCSSHQPIDNKLPTAMPYTTPGVVLNGFSGHVQPPSSALEPYSADRSTSLNRNLHYHSLSQSSSPYRSSSTTAGGCATRSYTIHSANNSSGSATQSPFHSIGNKNHHHQHIAHTSSSGHKIVPNSASHLIGLPAFLKQVHIQNSNGKPIVFGASSSCGSSVAYRANSIISTHSSLSNRQMPTSKPLGSAKLRASHQPLPQPFAASMSGNCPLPSSLPPANRSSHTIIKYQYSNEMPYSIKIKSSNITLRQFKQSIIRKTVDSAQHRLRYFFKRKDEDDDNHLQTNQNEQYTMEELTDDNDLLPLCNGKIFAKIEIVSIGE